MTSILPQHEGYLPYFLLYTAVSVWIHSAVCYVAVPTKALVQFSEPAAPPPHSLIARVYGLKNLYIGLIRAYAAYYISNPELYTLALATFAGVLFFYFTEVAVYRTVGFSEAMITFVTETVVLGWMWTHKDFYLV